MDSVELGFNHVTGLYQGCQLNLRICFFLQPPNYVSHLIGHEGPGSILSALKARGWSNNLIAGQRTNIRGFCFFGVSVDLTEEGLNHINDIVKLIFQVKTLLEASQYVNLMEPQY